MIKSYNMPVVDKKEPLAIFLRSNSFFILVLKFELFLKL